MSTAYKKLGATVVVADTDTALYTVPGSTSAIVSSIIICNKGTSTRTFRIAHISGGGIGAVGAADYLYYDLYIRGRDTFVVTIGITMATTDTLLVRANHADVTFTAEGSEIS